MKNKKFTKEQICSSRTYAQHGDLLSVLLEDGKEYTLQQVNKILTGYLKGVI